MEDKSQSDKNFGDCKKSDASASCQCACHSKASRTTATDTVSAAAVDLTVSPCKETAEPSPSAPEGGKQYFVFPVVGFEVCCMYLSFSPEHVLFYFNSGCAYFNL